MAQKSTEQAPRVVIVGAGLAGLVLSLALKKHCGITAAVYEQAPRFDDNVGGAIGLYANGLRVLRDISPDLLRRVRDSGYPYIYRRWMRHDGMQVAVAREDVLTKDPDLQRFVQFQLETSFLTTLSKFGHSTMEITKSAGRIERRRTDFNSFWETVKDDDGRR